jgi:hypothetical protein
VVARPKSRCLVVETHPGNQYYEGSETDNPPGAGQGTGRSSVLPPQKDPGNGQQNHRSFFAQDGTRGGQCEPPGAFVKQRQERQQSEQSRGKIEMSQHTLREE